MIRFFIDQHGCAKNQVDGELICTRLAECGHEQIFDAAQADLIIINSCGFIESAKKESLDAVYAAKRQNPRAKILLAGCLAERYASIFARELPEADAIFGNGDVLRIDEVVRVLFASGKASESGDFSASADLPANDAVLAVGNSSATPRQVLKPEQHGVCAGNRTHFLSYRGAAFVKVTEGCNNRCTFCAIPIIRGELRSRSEKNIVDEIKTLVARGFYEINLIGQDLAAYGTGSGDACAATAANGAGRGKLPEIGADGRNLGTKTQSALAHLLEKISQVAGNFRVRLLYIHPDHFNRDIFPVMQKDSRIVPYFDIPFQSGSDAVIRAMNRKCTASEYKRLVHDIRSAFPDAAIRTTFLTGFPGETEEDAKATREFLCSIESDWSGCFTYSREEDTPAYNIKKRVPARVAKARAAELQNLQAEITKRRLQERVGKEYDVLVEEVVDDSASGDVSPDSDVRFAIARAWFQAPEVDGNIVVRFDADDDEAIVSVRSGNVVRVFADRVNGVDIEARFLSAVKTQPVRALDDKAIGLLFAPDETQ